ncbi:hypothetical protein Tco_0819738 [Tanacetum coccineum]|uniref:Uncharacterized protein n=1 Tax=Tanacetum coccineum TaxID=301880 RepID=A0ABQ5AC46_9ASTR
MAQENRKSLGRHISHHEHHYKEDPKIVLEDSWSDSNEDDHKEANEACLMAVGSQKYIHTRFRKRFQPWLEAFDKRFELAFWKETGKDCNSTRGHSRFGI